MSLSRTGRPLTNRYCPSALARVSDGAAAKPSTTTPSRSARTSIALERKSEPRISPSRVSRPAPPGSAAAQVTGAALLPAPREGNVGPRHCETPHHLADRLRLGAVGLEKFQPRRRRVKQIADLDA